MDLEDLIGPLPAPLGRWMLRRLVAAGGYAGARDRGVLRIEGRDYVMRDGDVITVKFTP